MSKSEQCPVTGYLIDPVRQTVEAVDMTGGPEHLANIYKLLQCDVITSAWGDGVGLYCDDEGLLQEDVHHFFAVKGKTEPIAGRGLVLDVDDHGRDTTPRMSLDDVRARVSFLQPFAGGLWDRQHATALHRHELNSFQGHLGALEREAAE